MQQWRPSTAKNDFLKKASISLDDSLFWGVILHPKWSEGQKQDTSGQMGLLPFVSSIFSLPPSLFLKRNLALRPQGWPDSKLAQWSPSRGLNNDPEKDMFSFFWGVVVNLRLPRASFPATWREYMGWSPSRDQHTRQWESSPRSFHPVRYHLYPFLPVSQYIPVLLKQA